MPKTLDEDAPVNEATEAIAAAATESPTPFATFASLKAKPRRSLTFPITLAGNGGTERTVNMKFLAISAKRYDELVAESPPKQSERQSGAVFNLDTFAPALISAVSANPELTVEQATELWNSPDWANGEVTALFINAQRVCNGGIDIPFNGRD